jgi:hypothetical protein
VQQRKDRVVERAWIEHTERGRLALRVHVFFNAPKTLSDQSIGLVASGIATAVARTPAPESFDAPALQVDQDLLPPSVGAITIRRAMRTPCWDADAGGWVAPVQPSELAAILQRKARRATAGRCHCEQLWLVIVYDAFSRAHQAELSPEARCFRYGHVFDRALWFEPHHDAAHELQ